MPRMHCCCYQRCAALQLFSKKKGYFFFKLFFQKEGFCFHLFLTKGVLATADHTRSPQCRPFSLLQVRREG